jgi:rare lipoprotein A (peptidoglycan hydrolase)
MRIDAKKPTVVLVLSALISLLIATGAMAATGGASAPVPGTSAAATVAPKAHATSIATWFGPGFFGQKTACGQTLTRTVIGVANRTLPCGTLVRVAYRGHSLTVPVLDRGPYSHIGADWDLTAGAAEALGITETVRIKTQVIGYTANSPELGLPATPAVTTIAGGAVAG